MKTKNTIPSKHVDYLLTGFRVILEYSLGTCVSLLAICFSDKERYGVVIEKIVGICMSSCEIVFPVVKQVAPEGYMPSDSEVG